MYNHQKERKNRLLRRTARTRAKIAGTAIRPRASLFRSNKHITIQLIDDETGRTVCAASDLEIKGATKMKKQDVAKAVGVLLAEKAGKAKITSVVFDRRGYQYHGRVQMVATGMREGGLGF